MSAWGPLRFIAESKSYFSYPHCNKLSFWVYMPLAMVKFYWFCLRDAVRELAHRLVYRLR